MNITTRWGITRKWADVIFESGNASITEALEERDFSDFSNRLRDVANEIDPQDSQDTAIAELVEALEDMEATFSPYCLSGNTPYTREHQAILRASALIAKHRDKP